MNPHDIPVGSYAYAFKSLSHITSTNTDHNKVKVTRPCCAVRCPAKHTLSVNTLFRRLYTVSLRVVSNGGKRERKVTQNLERRNESTWMVLMNATAPSGIVMYFRTWLHDDYFFANKNLIKLNHVAAVNKDEMTEE